MVASAASWTATMRVPHSAARGWSLAARASSPCARLSRCSNYSSHSHLCCLPTTTYPDCRLYTSGSCTPGLSHTALSPFSTRTRTTIIPCSHKKRSSSHSNGWYAHHAMLTIAPATLPAQKENRTPRPSTRLPQYSLDEEVRIVCYSPPLPKKRRGMCVWSLSRNASRRPQPLLLVVLFPTTTPYKCAK